MCKEFVITSLNVVCYLPGVHIARRYEQGSSGSRLSNCK
jgi:hypothetical protein